MKATILTLTLATLCWSASGEEQKVTQVIPAKAYNVLSNKSGQPEIVGRIPDSPNVEIKVRAESINSEVSVTLKGKAEVVVSANGKSFAIYEGADLVLAPTEAAAEPLNYQRLLDRVKEFDGAIAVRNAAAVAAFFSKDIKVTVELLGKDGVQTRTLSPQEYAEYMKGVFPAALSMRVIDYFNQPGNPSRIPEERAGTSLQVSPDGITATGWSNVRYVVILPEGQFDWYVIRHMAVELRGKDIFITSLDVKIPQAVKENWPTPKEPMKFQPIPVGESKRIRQR